MKNLFFVVVVVMYIAVFSSSGAKLEITEQVQKKIDQFSKCNTERPTNLADPSIIGKEEIDGRPVVFEVIRAKKDERIVQQLCRNVSVPENVVFNAAKGAYCYNNIVLQKIALKSTDAQDISMLKTRAIAVLEQLLGKDLSSRFVYSNEEIDYVKERDDGDERILRKTCRFTRKINGRHILDNTSFVRLSFSADQELSAFEIVNPEIRPVRNVDRLIRTETTEIRLKEYAANKQTAVRNGPGGIENAGVSVIKAQKVFDTYLSKKAGDKVLLLPNISFYSEYHLDNGDQFKNWSHFCLDADFAPDIKKEFIDDYSR